MSAVSVGSPAGIGFGVDADGFLTDPRAWSEELAVECARGIGIPELSPEHWLVVNFVRDRYFETGAAPTIRTVGKESGVHVRELYELFPTGPMRAAAKIAGIPNPAGPAESRGLARTLDGALPPIPATIGKVSIVVSKGSLEGIYPALSMANGARLEGIDADVFFTFFGIEAIRRGRQSRIKVATVGNPGLHLPTLLGAVPGFSHLATKLMRRRMEKLDIPPVSEYVELIADSGARLYACRATVEMLGLTRDDLVPQVAGIVSIGELYGLAAGGEIVFT